MSSGDVPLAKIEYEYICIQVNHHKEIAETITKYQQEGWRLHTYQAAGTPNLINHYLLFTREAEW